MTTANGAREFATPPRAEPSLSISHVTKTFAGMVALDDVSLSIAPGEIRALLGSNGSGKSTLIKILSGVYQSDPGGQIRAGQDVCDAATITPAESRSLGVRVVHQDLGIFSDMSVAENLALGGGYQRTRLGRISWGKQRAWAKELLDYFEIDALPGDVMSRLTHVTRTRIAIARALQEQVGGDPASGLLILDEPTASLPAHEVHQLEATLRNYARRGQAILFVSHRLDEVRDIADTVTVLRDGVSQGTRSMTELSDDDLVELIVGRRIEQVYPTMPEATSDEIVLSVERLSAGPLRSVDLEVRRGEVVGVGGLVGSGRTELLEAICGALEVRSGSIRFEGQAVRTKHPRDAFALGIGFVPEDRARDAAFPDLSVSHNISIASIADYFHRGLIQWPRLEKDVRTSISQFLVKTASPASPLNSLSGGNQQKVILTRWLRRNPKLMLLDEPTQGVDIGARSEIYGLIRRAVEERGMSAVIVASDFDELAHVSDRVVILRDGKVSEEIRAPELSETSIMRAVNRKPKEVGR